MGGPTMEPSMPPKRMSAVTKLQSHVYESDDALLSS
jgi:hypothetical protein